MSKRPMKTAKTAVQGGIDPLSGATLSADQALNDTDRAQPKRDGGTYRDENFRVVDPVAHLARHGNLRTREDRLADLKSAVDDRAQIMHLANKVNNQLLAFERRVDHPNAEVVAFLTGELDAINTALALRSRAVETALKAYRADSQLADCALNVRGLGPITVAHLLVYVDFAKEVCRTCQRPEVKGAVAAEHAGEFCTCPSFVWRFAAEYPSSLWRYVGLDVPSHARYTKGEAGGGNKTLRTALWNTAVSMMKDAESPYRIIYDAVKTKLAASERLVKSRNTQGKLVEVAWKDTKPSHRHGAALRAMIKHLLADYWYAGRTFAGLPTTGLYAEMHLGHTGIVNPRARGWQLP